MGTTIQPNTVHGFFGQFNMAVLFSTWATASSLAIHVVRIISARTNENMLGINACSYIALVQRAFTARNFLNVQFV